MCSSGEKLSPPDRATPVVAIVTHPFIIDLGEGMLPVEKFRAYFLREGGVTKGYNHDPATHARLPA